MKLPLRRKDFRLQLRERNTRADWPELRDDRLKVEIFQLGAKIVPLETRRPHRIAPNAARKNIASIAATHVCTLTFHGIRSREFCFLAFGVNAP